MLRQLLPLMVAVGMALIVVVAFAAGTASTVPRPILPLPQSAFVPIPTPPYAPPPNFLILEPDPTPSPRPPIAPTPRPSPKATPRPRAVTRPAPPPVGSVHGVATWYCDPYSKPPSVCTHGYPASGAYGAAGPALRAALGLWRGKTVWVNGVAVKLVDWCACGGGHVIDVYHSTWVKIPNPSHVTVTW